jgi:DnaJ-class molecular chaperone
VYHPDIGGETCNASKMAEVNAAYDAIVRDREGSVR